MLLLLSMMLAASVTATAGSVSSAGGQALGNLSGVNLRLTLIHEEGYTNMLGDDGLLLPTEEWSGFLIDLLLRVSEHSGLKYTLHSSSGNYSDYCAPSNLTGAARAAFYAKQYNCGQGDAVNNATDVLWGMYYVTRFRMDSGFTFTVPFAADKGLTMLTSAGSPPTLYEESLKIFRPFEPLAWALSLVSAVVYAGLMWLMEAGHSRRETGRYDTEHDVYQDDPPKYKHDEQDWRHYWGSEVNNENTWGFYKTIYGSMQTLLAHDLPEVTTKSGFLYTWIFSFYAVVWIAAYTANLAAILASSTAEVAFDSLHALMVAQQSGQVGPACVKLGSAYVAWLEVNFPKLKLKKMPATTLDIAKEVAAKQCDVLIDASPQVEYVQAAECQLKLVIPGQPLNYGVTDMALAVRDGLDSHTLDSITYWIQSLKQCARNDRSPHCYGRENIAAMFDVYTKSTCGSADQNNQAIESLSYKSFTLFYTLIIGVGVLLVVTSSETKSPLVRFLKYSLTNRWKRWVAKMCSCRTEQGAEPTKKGHPAEYSQRLGKLIADVIQYTDAHDDADRRSQLDSMVTLLRLISAETDPEEGGPSSSTGQNVHISSLRTLFKFKRSAAPDEQQKRELKMLKNFVRHDKDLLDYLLPTNAEEDSTEDERARVRVLGGKFTALQAKIFDALEAYYVHYHVESWVYLIELRTQLSKKRKRVNEQPKCRGDKTERAAKTHESQQQICESQWTIRRINQLRAC
jgi:hypothetical protein